MRLTLGVVVTNYNTWNLTHECIDACLGFDAANIDDFLVYDDCSTVPNPRPFDPRIRLVIAEANTGLVRALNLAIGMMKTDIIVIFDCDARPITPFAERTRREFETQPKLGQVGYATVSGLMDPTESYAMEPNFWSILLGQNLYSRYERCLRPQSGKFVVYTCAMAIRRNSFVEIGGFDENFDWLDLDLDYSMRLNRSSWAIRVDPRVKAVHVGGGTPQATRNRVMRYYKNRWYLLQKFNLLPLPGLVKALTLVRLRVELLILILLGKVIFRNPIVCADKLQSRKDLLGYCRANY